MKAQTASVLAAAWLSLALSVAPWGETWAAARKKPTATATSPQPATRHVFRCGDSYQAEPCPVLDATSRTVKVQDSRTSEQIRAAFEARQRGQRDMRALDKALSKRARARASKPQLAVGLSCRQPGDRPFEACGGQPIQAPTSRKKKPKPQTERYLAMSPEAS